MTAWLATQLIASNGDAQQTNLTAKLLLALASTVILGSESQGSHDHVTLCTV
jgi:hypothetical protein